VQETLEAEMTETLAAEKGERTEGRLGYRSGYYPRALITRVGKIELRVRRGNQDGSGASIRMRELRRARDVGRA
jgi:transposase-like protein